MKFYTNKVPNALNERERERESNSWLNSHCENRHSDSWQSIQKTIDCHADFDKSARNDGVKSAFSYNDNSAFCHTERSEVSQSKINNRDISGLRPQYDNVNSVFALRGNANSSLRASASERGNPQSNTQIIDCHDSAFAESRNDSKPKNIALSLITSALLAGIASLDIAAAACQFYADSNSGGIGYQQTLRCTGVSNINDYMNSSVDSQTHPAYYRRTIWDLQGSTNERNIAATFSTSRWNGNNFNKDNVSALVHFNGLQARNTDITITNNSTDPIQLTLQGSGGAYLKSLTIAGHIQGANNNFTNTTIERFENQGTISGVLRINGGSTVGSLTNSGTIGTLVLAQPNTNVTSISGSGTINELHLGGAYNHNTLSNTNIGNTVNKLLIGGASVTISSGNSWNHIGNNKNERITIAGGCSSSSCLTVANGALTIYMQEGVDRTTEYQLQNLVASGTTAIGSTLRKQHIALDNEDRSGRGTKLIFNTGLTSFRLEPDGGDAYITDIYRALILGNLRRNTVTQNILDTMTTKTFHSDRYYNQEVELRLLQYDMSRLTNRSSKFTKTTRKNQKKVDKVREKMAKLTLEQSKGQNLDKGYNNFELIDQLDAIFIPYTGRRDWRFFALPYASHSYVDLGTFSTIEYSGGALFGFQRNLRAAGIMGAYLGYEYTNTDTQVRGSQTAVQNNSLQVGLNYYKAFAITAKVMEGFIKGNIRGSVDLPQFRFETAGKVNTVTSDQKGVLVPLVANGGAELRGGVTFYQFKRNSYIAPEVGLSYDVFWGSKMRFDKPYIVTENAKLYPIGGDERYGSVLWHLPQVSASVRYYKMWGNTFRTNLKAGVKYNILNKQQLGSFILAGQEDFNKRYLTLPSVYGNVALDLIWMIKKNHELSFGYDGLFYANTFDKKQTSDWFNGVTTNLNFKYAYWFGGSDYVTDKDGNAVARSIAEGGKKSKKDKKPKKKKTKKKKSKVVYIDG